MINIARIDPQVKLAFKVGFKAFPTNIELGWKLPTVTNTVAYQTGVQIMVVKSFLSMSWGQCYETFYGRKLQIFALS